MVAQSKQWTQNLYDVDYHLWLVETLKQLEDNELESLDIEHLIEEILDFSRREKRRLDSLMTRLLEHLLKLQYWQAERRYNLNHWKREIRNFRKQINRDLKVSPSLKGYLAEQFDELYQDARELVADASGLPLAHFPVIPIAGLDMVLDETWLPIDGDDS
jgi:signal transduction histidine kinase